MILETLLELFSKELFVEIFWYTAMITVLIAFFQKDDFTTKKLMLLASLFWGAHFFLQDMYAWFASTVIFWVRFFSSIKWHKNTKVYFIILTLTFAVWFLSYDGLYSLLPILASVNGTTAYFFLEKIKLRIAMLAWSQMWLWYHFIISSMSGMLNEIMAQSILIFTIYRIIHPMWGTQYYAQKIKDILKWRSRPDYDRFVFIYDRMYLIRKKIGENFRKIIHYDLRNLISRKKKYLFFNKIWHH